MLFSHSKKYLYFSYAYMLFIIYGSLIPLDYQFIPFDDALLSFQQIHYLNLGAASRADWISNIVLYVPLTFLLASAFSNRTTKFFQFFISSIFILAFSLTLAVTIEFYQHFFPPRTVSQNDLIAETIGSVIGLALWLKYRKQLQQLYEQILQGDKQALNSRSQTLFGNAWRVSSAYRSLSQQSCSNMCSQAELGNKPYNYL